MSIDEVKQRKLRLQEDLTRLVREFEGATGVTVTALTCPRVWEDTDFGKILTLSVIASVELL